MPSHGSLEPHPGDTLPQTLIHCSNSSPPRSHLHVAPPHSAGHVSQVVHRHLNVLGTAPRILPRGRQRCSRYGGEESVDAGREREAEAGLPRTRRLSCTGAAAAGFGAGAGKGGSGNGCSVGGVGNGGLPLVAVLLRVDIACSREGDQDELPTKVTACIVGSKWDGGMQLAAGWFIAVPSLRYRPCSRLADLAVPSLQ